jgi:hypothetical protein
VRSTANLYTLGASQLPGLTSLVLHDLPRLRNLALNAGFELFGLPGLAALAPSLQHLAIKGARAFGRAPESLSALVNLTRLDLTLRQPALEQGQRNLSKEPLLAWMPTRSGASPLEDRIG